MKLWGGRFEKNTSDDAFAFNASLRFDVRLLPQDVKGSAAHVRMLGKQGILTEEEARSIEEALAAVLSDYRAGTLSIPGDAEDVHSLVEAEVTKRIGEAGKKMHTGRSRNDQVALDMKLYIREETLRVRLLLADLLSAVLRIMENGTGIVMPGFTHMQKAQPVTLAHHFGAYFEMFRRDISHLASLCERMDTCPLGSGALAGTTYPLDRAYTAELLGFDAPCRNSMDGVSDRDHVIEFLSCLSVIMMHLSRMAEEIITWNSDEYRFVTIDDGYSTGSSIMPQKKNPDIAELVRGKCGRVYGALESLLVTMKGLPLAYNKDMQEDKEGTFDAADTVSSSLRLFTEMLSTLVFHPENMARSAQGGFSNATDLADYLVGKGMAFRDAHGVTGRVVLSCIEKHCTIGELSLEELKAFSPLFEEDVFEAVSLEACVSRRRTAGAPGAMEQAVAECRTYLEETKTALEKESRSL